MKNKKNKGFTLVELIIAMSILGVVLSIGYGIINSSNESIKEQKNVFSGQMSINNINKFLTKDLEQSKKLEGPFNENGVILSESELQSLINSVNTTKEEIYKYTITINNDTTINYEVLVSKSNKNNRYEYDITRKQDTGNIEIVSKQPLNLESGDVQIPIIMKKSGSTYDIELGYEYKNRQNIYKFSVSSRYI